MMMVMGSFPYRPITDIARPTCSYACNRITSCRTG